MLTPVTLTGPAVRLEPLVADHARALTAAAAGDRSSYAYTWVPEGLADAERYVQAALEQAPRSAPPALQPSDPTGRSRL